MCHEEMVRWPQGFDYRGGWCNGDGGLSVLLRPPDASRMCLLNAIRAYAMHVITKWLTLHIANRQTKQRGHTTSPWFFFFNFFFGREILWFGCEVLWKFEIFFLLISSSMYQGSKFERWLGGWELRVLHSPGSRKDAWPWVCALLGGDPGADGKAGDTVYCALPWTRLLPDTNHLAHYG